MSRGQTRDWNKEKVALDRRGSDGEYDVSYHKSHRSERPGPSYYGPNFSNVENKRSASLAYGDIRHPVTPDRYGKRPQPYTSDVKKDYNEYKKYGDLYSETKAKTDSKYKTLLKTPRNDDHYRQNIEMARDLSHDTRLAANTAAASRSGFAHKYPYAYDGQKGKEGHERAIETLRAGAKNASKAERKTSKLLGRN
ncbi:hypothetical protein IFM51744_08518 [Aspergillus udagawae]|nr:hypothetical protein IFM51744_08518 [Aspergillus udagawae]